jgi:hypothetical protein
MRISVDDLHPDPDGLNIFHICTKGMTYDETNEYLKKIKIQFKEQNIEKYILLPYIDQQVVIDSIPKDEAGDRYIFQVPTGNMPTARSMEYIDSVKEKIQEAFHLENVICFPIPDGGSDVAVEVLPPLKDSERYVFHIPTGSMPKGRAETYLTRLIRGIERDYPEQKGRAIYFPLSDTTEADPRIIVDKVPIPCSDSQYIEDSHEM